MSPFSAHHWISSGYMRISACDIIGDLCAGRVPTFLVARSKTEKSSLLAPNASVTRKYYSSQVLSRLLSLTCVLQGTRFRTPLEMLVTMLLRRVHFWFGKPCCHASRKQQGSSSTTVAHAWLVLLGDTALRAVFPEFLVRPARPGIMIVLTSAEGDRFCTLKAAIETVMSEIDIFVSSTGHVNHLDPMKRLKNNAFVANTGHFDNEFEFASSEGWTS